MGNLMGNQTFSPTVGQPASRFSHLPPKGEVGKVEGSPGNSRFPMNSRSDGKREREIGKTGLRLVGCGIIAALMKRESTRTQIAEASGAHINTVNLWLRELRLSGLVYRRFGEPAKCGRRPVVYCLQAKPFEVADFGGVAQ